MQIDTVVGGRLPLSELQQYIEGETHETTSIARPSLVRMRKYWLEGPIMCPKLSQPDEFEARPVSEYTGVDLTSHTTALARLSDLVFSPMSLAEATAIPLGPRFKLDFFTMMADCAPQRPTRVSMSKSVEIFRVVETVPGETGLELKRTRAVRCSSEHHQ